MLKNCVRVGAGWDDAFALRACAGDHRIHQPAGYPLAAQIRAHKRVRDHVRLAATGGRIGHLGQERSSRILTKVPSRRLLELGCSSGLGGF